MSPPATPEPPTPATSPRTPTWLPRVGTPSYHVMLVALATFVLGPLAGVTAAYMNFSLGFFVSGQVMAGILGSAVTYGYGPSGRQGANYIQTAAGSVGSMCGMAVVMQAMVWLGMPIPSAPTLMLFFLCVGMFGVGIGMLYTPLLVDSLRLEFPSGHAVANILRALTDKRLLRRSIAKLGGGTGVGVTVAGLADRFAAVGQTQISASNVGAGMVVGSRVTVSAAVTAGLGVFLVPTLRAHGWLGAHDPFRKLAFLTALAMIVGAAVVDLTLIGIDTTRRLRARRSATDAGAPASGARVDAAAGGAVVLSGDEDPRGARVGTRRLIIWCVVWAVALIVVAHVFMHQPIGWLLLAIGLSLVFVCINGISTGITDSNPISSAFVLSVLLMSALGLGQPIVALIAASVLLLSINVGVDMQQDRSTGWRLGTNRVNQFRYQALGIVMGAVLSVVLARLFMRAYPVLTVDSYAHPEVDTGVWQSAMTFKLVGAIRDLGHLPGYKLGALALGFALGLGGEIARRLVRRSRWYRAWAGTAAAEAHASANDGQRGRFARRARFAFTWLVDAVLLPSPYASSFGGFIDLPTACWFALGGVITSVVGTVELWRKRGRRNGEPAGDALPEDMSTTSLVGGGLIAGESLFTLAAGVWGLIKLL